jgi:hypothetical protein
MQDSQATFSLESTPTVWKSILTLKGLQDNWETFAKTSKFALVKHGIEKGLEKLGKWYMAPDQSNMDFICLGKPNLLSSFILGSNFMYQALKPSIKLEYAKQKWEKDAYNQGVAVLKKVVCSFLKIGHHTY